jgi:hypothetical protein
MQYGRNGKTFLAKYFSNYIQIVLRQIFLEKSTAIADKRKSDFEIAYHLAWKF